MRTNMLVGAKHLGADKIWQWLCLIYSQTQTNAKRERMVIDVVRTKRLQHVVNCG